jgi:hypothetical protein
MLATTPHDLTRDPRLVQAILVAGMYVPAAILVFRLPNVGPVPVWAERALARAPQWIRRVLPGAAQSA